MAGETMPCGANRRCAPGPRCSAPAPPGREQSTRPWPGLNKVRAGVGGAAAAAAAAERKGEARAANLSSVWCKAGFAPGPVFSQRYPRGCRGCRGGQGGILERQCARNATGQAGSTASRTIGHDFSPSSLSAGEAQGSGTPNPLISRRILSYGCCSIGCPKKKAAGAAKI